MARSEKWLREHRETEDISSEPAREIWDGRINLQEVHENRDYLDIEREQLGLPPIVRDVWHFTAPEGLKAIAYEEEKIMQQRRKILDELRKAADKKRPSA